MWFGSRNGEEFVDSNSSVRVKDSGKSRFGGFRVGIARVGRGRGRESRSDLSEDSDRVN